MGAEGRTFWWALDAAWFRRERQADIAIMFGPVGLVALLWLGCHAKELNVGDGYVKSGYSAVALGIGASQQVEEVRNAIRYAAEVGALDDFEEEDGKRFTARLSGWAADQERALRQGRNARYRETARDGDETDLRLETDTETDNNNISVVFEAWVASTERTAATKLDAKRRRRIAAALKDYTLVDVLDAVEGWRFSPHHRGENERRTVYNDLDLLLRDSARIEMFRDLKRSGGAGVQSELPTHLLG